jgi:hypothetical protein
MPYSLGLSLQTGDFTFQFRVRFTHLLCICSVSHRNQVLWLLKSLELIGRAAELD